MEIVANQFVPGRLSPFEDGMYLCLIENNGHRSYKATERFMGRWAIDDEEDEVVGWVKLPDDNKVLLFLTRFPNIIGNEVSANKSTHTPG